MGFWDGVLIASVVWLLITVYCMFMACMYEWSKDDLPKMDWCDAFEAGWNAAEETRANKEGEAQDE